MNRTHVLSYRTGLRDGTGSSYILNDMALFVHEKTLQCALNFDNHPARHLQGRGKVAVVLERGFMAVLVEQV